MRRLAVFAALALLFAPAALQAQASPAPYTSGTRYDASGRVTGTISADPDTVGSGNPFLAVRNTYDGAGRLTKVETGTLSSWQSEVIAPSTWDPAFTVIRAAEFQYDGSSRKLREWTRDGSDGTVRTLTEFSYYGDGRLSCTAVRMNPLVFTFSGTPNACVPSQQGQAPNDFGPDRITKNIYDAAGQRVQLREGVGSADEAAESTWAYSPNGRVVAVIDGNGNRAELRYDGYDRQDRWIFPSTTRPSNYNDATQATALASAGVVNSNDYEEYGYDPNGNRTSLRKRDNYPTAYGNIAYSYDALNRMTLRTVPERSGLDPWHTRDVYYGYDLRGLQTHARFDSHSGPGVVNGYDGFGQLSWTDQSDNAGTVRRLAYQYDRNGNRTRIAHPDGVIFDQSYDGLGRPVLLSGAVAGTPVFVNYTAHGAPGNISRMNSGASYYSYDGVQRLIAVLTDHGGTAYDVTYYYGRDPASGLSSLTRTNDQYAWAGHYQVSRAYTTNGLNQYSQAGSATFSYDANGNLTSDGANSYTYEVENRLVTRTNGSGTATLRYDPLGRLWVSSAPGFETVRYLYDGDALVAEYDASGSQLARYVHGPTAGADDPLLWYGGASVAPANARYLHADNQGSIVGISDGSNTLIAINRYDEYGIPASTNAGRFQYTGQIWLPELGMYYYKNRIYSPTLGRMMQTDPVGYTGGVNLYAYVNDDPINFVDPDGQQAQALLPLLCTGPQVVGCVVAAGVGTGVLCLASSGCRQAAGEAVGSIVRGLRGWFSSESNEEREPSAADRRRRTAPRNAPRGTRPINDAGIDTEGIHDIKGGIVAENDDYVGITPDGTIVTTNPQTGNAENRGNISDHGVERETTRGRPRPPRRRTNDEEQ